MHLSNQSVLVILIVGIVAGWLAGKVVRGAGFGILGDLLVGIVGAFIGSWLLPRVGAHLGTGIVSAFVNAAMRDRAAAGDPPADGRAVGRGLAQRVAENVVGRIRLLSPQF